MLLEHLTQSHQAFAQLEMIQDSRTQSSNGQEEDSVSTGSLNEDEDEDEENGGDDGERDEFDDDDKDAKEYNDPVESLVLGRAKRVTAGNRLSSLLEKEGDDDLELLFAEDEEEDVEFEDGDVEAASDVQLDSSSDDEDHGPERIEGDLDGERELEKQDRVERLQKRKAQKGFRKSGGLRKRLKLGPIDTKSAPTTPAYRPRKKSERVSWIPTPEEGPTRSSTRKQTVQNKEVVHLRMLQSEKRRVKLIGVMEAAAKRKEASKPKTMTQRERLEEAARTERKNAKSLNRWEETEKKRVEDQEAKMKALQNRQLSGPVITRWSGMVRWVDGKIGQIGAKAIQGKDQDREMIANGKDRKRVPTKRAEDESSLSGNPDSTITQDKHTQPKALEPHVLEPAEVAPVENLQQAQVISPQGVGRLLDGIHYYASLPVSVPPPQLRVQDHLGHDFNPLSSLSNAPEALLPKQGREPKFPMEVSRQPWTPLIEYSARNLVTLKNIDVNAMRTPELQNHVLLKKRNGKVPSRPLIYGTIVFSLH